MPAVLCIDLYTPEESQLTQNELVPQPSVILQIDFDSPASAQAFFDSNQFRQLFEDASVYRARLHTIKFELTQSVHFPLPGQKVALPRTAPLSFVVRYYGPVQNAASFVDFYTRNHAPILSRFEGVRNVLCYVPLTHMPNKEIVDDRLLIGNEVVFDNQQSLLRALESDVLLEARADGKLFQPYGYSTHHVMHRQCIYNKGA